MHFWKRVITKTNLPHAPKHSTGVFYYNSIFIFCNFGQIFEYNFSTNTWKIIETNSSPGHSTHLYMYEGHSCVLYDSKMFIFGGITVTEDYVNEVLVFDLNAKKWIDIEVRRGRPAPREGHSAVVYKNWMYIFGGSVFTCLNDVWKFNLIKYEWHPIFVTGQIPTRRMDHSACVVDDSMFIFGGYFMHLGKFVPLFDLFSFNFKKNEWMQIEQLGNVPRHTKGHSMIFMNDKLIVFGGCDTYFDRFSNQTFEFNIKSRQWKELIVGRDIPSPRAYQTMMQKDESEVILFGGVSYKKRFEWMKDLHLLKLDFSTLGAKILKNEKQIQFIDVFINFYEKKRKFKENGFLDKVNKKIRFL